MLFITQSRNDLTNNLTKLKNICSVIAIALTLVVVLSGCSTDNGTGEHKESGSRTESRSEHDSEGAEHDGQGGEHSGEGRGEHDRDSAEHGSEAGEESGTELALNETYDKVRNGARLILAYNKQSNSFTGTVQNTTDKILERVRVEVHLSNGTELGPTTPADLEPGAIRDIRLTATEKAFEGWTAHPEIGSAEHGHGEEGD